MNDNTLVLAIFVWISLLCVFTYGTPDLLDHLTNNPVPIEECE